MTKKTNISITIPDYVLEVMRTIWEAGEEVYIVGGCVRDAILGKTPNDYDMTVSCPPQRTLEILSSFRTIPTGLAHGTVTAISQGRPIELTTFRVDGSYTDMRRPDSVSFTRSLADDLSRRDFTVNAMAYSPKTSLIDLFDGIDDAEAGMIRAVGEPEKRFSEDALRIMRAFRFSAQLGFDIHPDTLSGAVSCRDGLSRIAKERISAEFIKLICSPHPEKPLLLMKELGILAFVTPNYTPSDRVIGLLSAMGESDEERLGMYFADADGQTAKEILSYLRCSNHQKSGAVAISQNAHAKITEPRQVTALRAKIGDRALSAIRASVLLGESPREALSLAESNSAPCKISDLAIGGGDLIALGISGKDIGVTLEHLLLQVIDDPSLNSRESLTALAIKKQKEE